jgi:predicted transposase/invertase (TIGR01784 family)
MDWCINMSKKIKKTVNSQIHTPHDKLFKRSMCIPEVAKDFLNMHLPDNLKNEIDYTTIEILPETFIDESLSHHQVDALFKVRCNGSDLLIYVLVEQQSKSDYMMPVRSLSYKADIWASYIETNKQDPEAKLPPIINLHFYTGPKPYDGPLSIADLAKDNADIVNQSLIQPMINIWAGAITEEQLKTHPWASTLEYIMHHRKDPDIRPVLRTIAPNVRMFYMVGQTQFVLSLYTYIENVYTFKAPVEEFANIAGEEISERAKEDIMTIAEQMMHRGIEQGIEKGALNKSIEIAQRMIAEGSNPAFIMKVTGLSLEKIKELPKKTTR